MRNLVGMSLGQCVSNILDGYVKLEEVKEIMSNTTGLVMPPVGYNVVYSGKKGPKYDQIFDRYAKLNWYNHKLPHIEEVLMLLIPKIREFNHFLIDNWINADKLYIWERLDNGFSFVGEYVSKTNKVVYTAAQVHDIFQKNSATAFADAISISGIFAKQKVGAPKTFGLKPGNNQISFLPFPKLQPPQVPNP